ncbi:MAG: SIS domain-containing protein [Thermotogae bacterium]|nr:SIS domain-containing protein [Thermotogota bacterium]
MTKVEREIRDTLNDLPRVFDFTCEWVEGGDLSFLFDVDVMYFVGCGSSYYISITMAKYTSGRLGLETKAIPAGEIHFCLDENLGKSGLKRSAVLVSRSGESTEVILAGRKLKDLKIPILGVTIEENSSIFDVSDEVLVLPIEEESIVMTKSFTSIVLALQILVEYESDDGRLKKLEESIRNVKNVVDRSYELVEDEDLTKHRRFVFLGAGVYEGIARESALKLQEMSQSTTEAFSTYEYRHGPKSMAEDGVLITMFARGEEEEERLKRELEGYGGKVITIGVEGSDVFLGDDPTISVFMGAIFSQILGLKIAEEKKIDVENPRNLTKVVKIDG